MFQLNTDRSVLGKQRSTRRRACVTALVLASTLAGTFGTAAGTRTVQAAHSERICLETNPGCANLPPTPARVQTKTPFLTTALPAVTVQVTLVKRALHITGTNFTPGSKVKIAVINTSDWKPIWTGPLFAQGYLSGCSYPYVQARCGEVNPEIGMIDYTVRLSRRYTTSGLVVLYRAPRQTGVAMVKVQ